MRHHVKQRTLGRARDQRIALLRSLAISLITHGRIQTTQARAKELRPFIERLITKSKNDTVAARRLVAAQLGGAEAPTKTLFEHIAPRFADRPGGYTRITTMPQTGGRGRREAIIEFIA